MFNVCIYLLTQRLRSWVWKRELMNFLFGVRKNYVVSVTSDWMFVKDGTEQLRYRSVVLCTKRARWPFNRITSPGFQLYGENRNPITGVDIHQIIQRKNRLKNMCRKIIDMQNLRKRLLT